MTLSLTLSGAAITASATTRTLGGELVRFNVPGRTSRGLLRVRPGALRFPDDLTRVKLTEEHDRAKSRGHLAALEHTPTGIRASARVSDGPEGDTALREAADRTRDAFSFDVVDATIVGDEITDALVIAIGQVGIPAYDDARIDTVAANLTTGENMTDEQRARLAELAAMNNRSTEEETEFSTLQAAAVAEATANPTPAPAAPAAPEAVAASAVTASAVPAVPAGVPAPAPAARTQPQGGAFGRFVSEVTAALKTRAQGGGLQEITAALADVTHSAHTSVIEPPAWSGELWSGLKYEPQFSDLFTSGTLDHWEGKGWRFTSKLKMQDYAGDKAEIPTSTIGTEESGYEAARAAVGIDIDRKFFDFPNEGFVAGMFEQARESWEILKDEKVRAYALAQAVAARTDERLPVDVGNPVLPAQPTLLKAAAAAVRALKRRKAGTASWVYVNDDDLFTLMDVASKDVSAFLELFGIDPKNFRSSEDIPEGTVLAGVKPAATVRVLPGSPIRVDAQNLTRGGVDEAFFGYWAIEEHHTSGIAKVTFTPPA